MSRKMKDSGIEWIGKIPENWKITKVKRISQIYTGNSIKDSEKENYTDDKNSRPYIPTKAIDVNNSTIDYDNGLYIPINDIKFKIGKKGSTLLCIEGGSAGKKIAYLDQDVCFVNKLCCFESINFNSKYLYYYIKSPAFSNEFYFHISGLIGGVSLGEIKEFSITVPPFNEQQKIANFLDEKVKKIDNIIDETKESIEEYKKYRKAIVIKTVTKGLNPNVKMKETDSDWIGQIPEHWDYVRIQRLFEIIDERNKDPKATLLSLYTSIGVKPRNELEEKGNKAITVMNYKKVKKNDIIVNKLLAWMGAIGYSNYEGVTSPDYDVYRAKKDANVVRNYYNEYFRDTCFNGDCYKYGRGIMLMRWRTYPEEFLRIKVPNPPLEEQQEIANYLEHKCGEIDALIKKKEVFIEELENYKKSIIYEYVTGKKEVK